MAGAGGAASGDGGRRCRRDFLTWKQTEIGQKSWLRVLVPGLCLIVVFAATLMAACTPYPPPMTATPMLSGTALPTFTPGPSPTQRPTITPFPSPTVAPVQPPGPSGAATPFLGE